MQRTPMFTKSKTLETEKWKLASRKQSSSRLMPWKYREIRKSLKGATGAGRKKFREEPVLEHMREMLHEWKDVLRIQSGMLLQSHAEVRRGVSEAGGGEIK